MAHRCDIKCRSGGEDGGTPGPSMSTLWVIAELLAVASGAGARSVSDAAGRASRIGTVAHVWLKGEGLA